MAKQKKAPEHERPRGKNLKRNSAGNWVNKHGVVFTPEERKQLERAVGKANRKRAKMIEAEAGLPRMHEGKNMGETLGQGLRFMGKESDFIITKKTHSLQRFRDKKEFNRYLKYVERVNNPNYVRDRTRLYKKNFMKSLEDVYGDEAADIIHKMRYMRLDKFMEKVASDETLEIRYTPSDVKAAGRLNQIRAALGMDIEDEWADEFYE